MTLPEPVAIADLTRTFALKSDTELLRLAALREYGIDLNVVEPVFNRLVQLAGTVFNVPVALISLVEADRQIFAARLGVQVCETSRAVSFCSHAIRQSDIMVVLDATRDPRFVDNPLVTGPMNIRFYAGAPLVSPSGHAVGTFCIVDTKPRAAFDAADQRNLREFANLALDKMELRRLDLARHTGRIRFESIAANSPDAIICADQTGDITFWNAAAARLLGYQAAEIKGRGIDMILPRQIVERLREMADGEASPESRTVELDVEKKHGGAVPVELSVSIWREAGRQSFGAILRDITDRRANEDRLFRLAHLDPLTGIPNRTLLATRIEQALAKHQAATVVMVDLDGFKEVNDTLGHAAGDFVLARVAKLLQGCVRAMDTVARVGGDEFAILIPGLEDPGRAGQVVDAAIDSIAEIRAVEGSPVDVAASGGIAIYPLDGTTAEELLSSADLALYQAKAEGRHCRRFFTPGLRHAANAKRAYHGELRRARENDEFVLFYQPQTRLADGALMGAEALMRWRHPRNGLLMPADFIKAMEGGPLAAPMGDWPLRTGARQAAAWRAAGATDFRIGVNLFGAQFRTGDLADKVHGVLAEFGLPPAALELEITENIILRHDETLLAPLRQLRDAGVGVAFDDYGTGYASFSVLKRFPISRLKIDRSFVQGMCDSREDAAIVRAILHLVRSFGLGVIAEGVETEAQGRRLRERGCAEAQGYLIGRPMPEAEFTRHFIATAPAAPMTVSAG